ncbi:hypothetical protein D9M68_1004360 [compost metagenome]
MPHLAGGGGRGFRVNANGRCHRVEAGQGEAGRGGHQHEVAGFQGDGVPAIDREKATALEHHAEARVPEFRIAHRPATGAADAFGEHGAGLQQSDDVGKRIGHGRTFENEIWTIDCR